MTDDTESEALNALNNYNKRIITAAAKGLHATSVEAKADTLVFHYPPDRISARDGDYQIISETLGRLGEKPTAGVSYGEDSGLIFRFQANADGGTAKYKVAYIAALFKDALGVVSEQGQSEDRPR